MKQEIKIAFIRIGVFGLAAAVIGWLAPGCNRKPETRDEHKHEAHAEPGGHKEEPGHKDEHGHAEDEHGGHEGGKAVKLDEAQWKEFGIEVGTAGPGKLRLDVRLPGEVAANPDTLAHIVPRFPGIVKEVRKDIGTEVKKGEVLAVIESNESLTSYEVKSLIDGTVIEKHLVLGELVKEDVHAFVVADLSSVWVNLSVYQKDLPNVHKGQKVVVSAGHGIAEADGEISYVAPVVDEKTRTGLARVFLPNPDGRWRPGLFVTAQVVVSETEAPILVPKTALQTVNEKPCVFVLDDDGFEPRPVKLGRSNETQVEVLSGLEAGQRYVTQGAFTLKAELQKGAFGHGHAH